ncbi:hypothetical protein [Streptomyces sp. SAI-127]|uniref:hypothetical protein n=1 Tax=Streptomyces sp. SAI-127 TaxID=2940543 RepID=UPI0024738E2A|nr:hypothetical protein [Streptomyces sp. SAI-127]MDH6485495.1 hypothetical protein [Streptomyces sp. SAI-127]
MAVISLSLVTALCGDATIAVIGITSQGGDGFQITVAEALAIPPGDSHQRHTQTLPSPV